MEKYGFIIDRLKEIGSNQRKLAKHLGIDPVYINNMVKKGIREIKPTEIVPMAEYLRYDLQSFLNYINGKIRHEDIKVAPPEGGNAEFFVEYNDKNVVIRDLPLIGIVEAGTFKEACQWPEEDWKFMPAAVDANYKDKKLFFLKVHGNSMNKVFHEGTNLLCIDINDYPHEIRNGKFVIAQCQRAGLCEATVKRYTKGANEIITLEAMSTDTKYQNIILDGDNGNNYRIKAVVIGATQMFEDF